MADYDAVKMPTFDRDKRGDEAYQAEHWKQYQAAQEKQCAFILELYQAHPKHEKTVELLPMRWSVLSRLVASDSEKAKSLIAEIDAAAKKNAGGPLAIEAAHAKAQAFTNMIRGGHATRDELVEAVDAFIKLAPDDKRAARLLMTVAQRHTPKDQQVAAYKRMIKLYPDDRSSGYAKGKLRQIEQLGKPFKLDFTDAISGESVSLSRLNGKVVVLDFWATWCGPCTAEMPKMKEIYAEYKDKGVEFIGISLDQPEDKGGLTKLKEYCEKNEIPWPQYYQGDSWSGEYSTSWGINSIPSMFILDAKGNLYSTEARGKLEKMIPELLAKRDE